MTYIQQSPMGVQTHLACVDVCARVFGRAGARTEVLCACVAVPQLSCVLAAVCLP